MILSPGALEQVRVSTTLMQEHTTSLNALNVYIKHVILADTGIDIEREDWTLDPSTGLLVPNQPPATNEVVEADE